MKEKALFLLAGIAIGALLVWVLKPSPQPSDRFQSLILDSTNYVHSMDSIEAKKSLIEHQYQLREDSLASALDQANAIRRSRPHQPHSSDADTIRVRILRAIGELQH